MSIHDEKHNDKKRINDAILSFYYEYNHFIIPILYLDSKELKGCVIKARCYEFGCEVGYSIEEIKEAVEKSEELKLVLDNDIKIIKEGAHNYPELLKSAVDQLFECRKNEDENNNFIEDYNLNSHKDESKDGEVSCINPMPSRSIGINRLMNGRLHKGTMNISDNTRITEIEDKDEIVARFKGKML